MREVINNNTSKNEGGKVMNKGVPVWEKYALTITEAAMYFRIGENKLRSIVEENKDSDFVVKIGNRSLIKRKLFEEFLNKTKEL